MDGKCLFKAVEILKRLRNEFGMTWFGMTKQSNAPSTVVR